MKSLAKFLIYLYKKYLSSGKAKRCPYTPSCSSYTYQAIEKYGFLIGCFKGGCRILRCNPFTKGGFEPVRENYKGKTKWLI